MVPLVVRLFAQAFVAPEAQDHIVNAVSTPEIEANWKFLDRELQGVEYLAGDFSAADIAVTFTLEFGMLVAWTSIYRMQSTLQRRLWAAHDDTLNKSVLALPPCSAESNSFCVERQSRQPQVSRGRC